MWFTRTVIHKILVRITNREDPDLTFSSEAEALFVEAVLAGKKVVEI